MGRLVTQAMVTAATFRLCRSFRDTMSLSRWKPPTNLLAKHRRCEILANFHDFRVFLRLDQVDGRWYRVMKRKEKKGTYERNAGKQEEK